MMNIKMQRYNVQMLYVNVTVSRFWYKAYCYVLGAGNFCEQLRVTDLQQRITDRLSIYKNKNKVKEGH